MVPKKSPKFQLYRGVFFRPSNRSLKTEQTFIRHLPMYRVKAKLIRVAVFAKRAETAKPGNAGQLPARPRQCMGIMILPPSHRITQWGRLGEILGGVRFPWSSIAYCRLMISLPGGVVDKFGIT